MLSITSEGFLSQGLSYLLHNYCFNLRVDGFSIFARPVEYENLSRRVF